MNLNAYFEKYHPLAPSQDYPHVPRIECVDGFSLSVQASHTHYCTPRTNHGPYSAVEVGFPSSAPELIAEFAENADKPTGTVYGFVPIELVEQLIDLHGGIAEAAAKGK